MPAKIIPQSGVLEVQGRIKANSAVNDLDILTKKDFATKKEVQFRAGQTTTSFPKVIAVKISDGYEGDLPQGQVYSSETDTILGIANQTLANGSNYFLITNGVVNFNTTGANINDPVYADASTGNLSLIAAAKKVGVVLEVGVNGKVLINLGGESSSGRAGGDTNFIVDPNAAGGDANKFIEYSNAGTTPTNGSGGSATNTSFAKETASPLLRTAGDWKLTKAATNGQGEGIAYDFDIELGFVGRTLELTFNYSTSANYVSSDIGVFIYDKTNLSLIATNINDVSQTMGRPGTFICKFPATSSSLRIIFHVRTTNALAYTFSFSDLSVRPESRIVGAAIGDWQAFPSVAAGTLITATTTNPTYGSVAQNVAYWRRVGDSMEILWDYRQTTIGTAGSGTYLFNLPLGYTVDTSKISVNTSVMQSTVGTFLGHYNNGVNFYGLNGRVGVYSSTQLWISYSVVGDGGATASARTLGSGEGFNAYANTHYSIRATVPIVGWSSNVNLIQNATEFAYNTNTTGSTDTTSFGYGAEGIIFHNTGSIQKRVRFRQPIQITDKIEIEIWNGQAWQTPPIAASNPGTSVAVECWRNRALTSIPDTADIGIGLRVINSTDVDVIFANYAYDNGSLDSTWAEVAAANWRWRVRKSSGSAVGEIPPFVGAKYSGTSAIALTANVTTHKFNTKEYDTYNAYNTTTGIYTIPLTGYYRITTSISVNAISTFYFWVNGVQRNSGESTAAGNYSATGSAEFYLNAGDTIDIRQDNNVSTVTSSFPNFSISKIG